MADSFELIVIGGGPGGYVAAIRAGQLGLKVACVEKEKVLGGTCLRIGCIPSKALLESSERFDLAKNHFAAHGVKVAGVSADVSTMHKRKDQIVSGLGRGVEDLFKKNKVTRYLGHGRLAGPGKVVVESNGGPPTELTANHLIIATGSEPATLRGVSFDGEMIGSSTEALGYASPPGELIVIGAGAIGLELGSVWRRLGSKVTVLEYLDRILPEMDGEVAAAALRLFKRQGLEFKLGSRVTGASVKKGKCVVDLDGQPSLTCDRVLVAVGRRPNTEGLGLDTVGISLDERGRIPVDEHWQTTAPGVHAIGDVIAGPMLAHKAEEEAVACVEQLVTGYGHVNYDAIPSVVYTSPEVAGVGKTEEQLQKAGVAYRKGVFSFRGNSRARILDDTDGMAKILADKETDRILGVHVLSVRASDLIAEAGLAIESAASSEDLARTCHAHPTLSETLKEAALAVSGRAINA